MLLVLLSAFCSSIISVSFASTGTLSTSSYIVSKVGNYWVAQNGITSNIDFNDTDAYTVIQDCINNLQSNIAGTYGGTITIGFGSPLLTHQLVISNPDITLEGQGRATGLSGTFNGSLIQIVSGKETPSNSYTTSVTISNLLFYNDNSSLIQTAIYLNISGPAIYPITLEHLVIIGMNGIVTDAVTKGTDTDVLIEPTISDIYVENAPQFGIELWATLDATIDNAYIIWDSLGPITPVAGTTGIEITMHGESTGIVISNTRVLRAEWGITLNGCRDIWTTNVISDLCGTWAWNLNDTEDAMLTNAYGTSSTGTALLITGNSSDNKITSSMFRDSECGVNDTTENPQIFTATTSENNSVNWAFNSKAPFWMQWQFWTIMSTGVVILGGAVLFLRKRKLPVISFKYGKRQRAIKVNHPLTVDDYRYYGHVCLIFGIILLLIGIAVPLCTMTWESSSFWPGGAPDMSLPVAMPYLNEGIILVGIGFILIWLSQILHGEYSSRLKEQQAHVPPSSPQQPARTAGFTRQS